MNAHLAVGLRKVIGSHLFRSGLGHVWRDDRTWLEFARELVAALGGKVVLVDRSEYAKLVADANQFKLIRKYVEEYQFRRPKEQQHNGIRNPYARWAAEEAAKEAK